MIAENAVQPKPQQDVEAAKTLRVGILMSTYNGATFLAEQIESLISQSHQNWTIFVSDDGSRDATREILESYKKQLGDNRLVIFDGPCRGFSANFISLIKRPELEADFYAFCDQDDIWESEKLERAVRWCKEVPNERPALYCTRTQLVDANGTPIGLSPLFDAPPTFRNALVQSIAGGNTMLFNRSARQLLLKTHDEDRIVSHDWWAYLVVSGCGGIVHYDPVPTIGYRQHGNNLIGSNSRISDRAVRLKKMMAGTFREWNDANLQALQAVQPELSAESRHTLSLFIRARRSSLFKRLFLIIKSGVYRQTLLGNLGLTAAAILQRL
ncbi:MULTISPECIES: glycosyltransferase family 2 protein [Pseudomonadaceae]|nr:MULTISPECIES: glycosyltransferase family 2 protein [Pseudomonadaceae]